MPLKTEAPCNSHRRLWLKGALGLAVPGAVSLNAQALVTGNAAPTSWAVVSDPNTYTQAWTRRFTNVLVNPLSAAAAPGSKVTSFYLPEVAPNEYVITAQAARVNVLGVPGMLTNVWSYKNFETANATFPARSFQVQRGTPIVVRWRNALSDASGNPLPHLMPVDQSITTPKPDTGVPIAVHHHGSDSAFEHDGTPDQWSTPGRRQIGPGVVATSTDAADGIKAQYLNNQEASLHWYHDHADALTRINVNAGLMGLYAVRDVNEAQLQAANVIPQAPYEWAMVLQDRCFDAAGNMTYAADPAQYPPVPGLALPSNVPTHFPEMFGDVILVNGLAWPNLAVEPRPYRMRLLNGSDSRFYTLSFPAVLPTPPNRFNRPARPAVSVYKIGTDLGFLNNGVLMRTVTIAPGERMDLVIDFGAAAGADVTVTNTAATPFPGGAPVSGGAATVMRFQVTLPLSAKNPVPAAALLPAVSLRRTLDTPPLSSQRNLLAALPANLVRRRVLLGEGTDEYGRITPMLGTYDPVNPANNVGTLSFADAPTERPAVGTQEVWEFWNTTVDAHPVHMHLVQFRVMNRQTFMPPVLQATTMSVKGWIGVRLQGAVRFAAPAVQPPADECGWKDTVICLPGQVTRVVVHFPRKGRYVYHCHILSHEDHDMMRWYEVV